MSKAIHPDFALRTHLKALVYQGFMMEYKILSVRADTGERVVTTEKKMCVDGAVARKAAETLRAHVSATPRPLLWSFDDFGEFDWSRSNATKEDLWFLKTCLAQIAGGVAGVKLLRVLQDCIRSICSHRREMGHKATAPKPLSAAAAAATAAAACD